MLKYFLLNQRIVFTEYQRKINNIHFVLFALLRQICDCRNPAILYLRNSNVPKKHSELVTMIKYLSLFLFFSLFGLAATAQNSCEFNRAKYVKQLKKERKEKDKEMRLEKDSPLPEELKATFRGLNYFKPRPSFIKEARIERFDQATHFFMRTTTSRLPEYSVYGLITFKHKGRTFKLNVYQNIELVKKPGFEKHLFIPFNDLTNGSLTYGGGRYLDITETGADTLIIDFNKAYNPYCAYNHKYSCPIPPESNNLDLEIKAGEKKLHE